MKSVYLGLMVFVILAMIFSIKKLWNSSMTSARRLCKMLCWTVLCVVSSIFITFSFSYTFAFVAFGAYFVCLDWILYNLAYFCRDFSGRTARHGKFEKISFCLLLLDSVSFVVNVITHGVFDVYTFGFAGEIYYQYSGNFLYYIHLVLDYALILHSVVYLIIGLVKAPCFYKLKYETVLLLMIFVVVAHTLFQQLHLAYDFSTFFYAFVALFFYYGPTFIIPKRLITRTLNLLVDKMDNGIVLFDIYGKCVYVNAVVKKTFKTNKDNVFDIKPLCDWIDKDDFSTLKNYSEYFDVQINGQNQNFKLYFNRMTDENGRYIGSYYIIQNITEETDRIKIEHQRATRDKLTGLYNRDYFCEKVEHRLRFDRFTGYYIIVSDIVNFKLINDLFGTAFGDIVLKRMAEEIREKAQNDDIYGRIHNDHFVLLMPKRRFSEEFFLEAFQKTFGYLNNFAYSLICHIGVYEIDDRSIPVSVMCDRAFLALGTIKSDFNTSVAYYDESLRQDVMKMQELMNELPLALKYNELTMYLQPQVSSDEKLLGAEALVRWHHHEKGIIPPKEFIQVIEKIGMISEVDLFVWNAACKKLADWKKQGREDLYISINISPKDFYIVDVYETLTKMVEKYGIKPSNLNLEITETAIIMDLDRQLNLIERLRKYGFAIEMDDFGSGYSSLNMLKDITVDVLKIDMAFLEESENDEKSRKILEKIILLAKDLGMKVVTEGVEKREQIDFLSKLGCDIYQGYYFSRPVTVSEFEEKFLKG